MNNQQSTKSSKSSRFVFGIWLLALAIFLVIFIVALSSSPVAPDLDPEKDLLAGKKVLLDDQVFVFENLVPRGSLANPELKFEAGDEYVLTASALQGFYQRSDTAPVWDFSSEKNMYTIEAQLFHRDPYPAPMNDAVARIEWEMEAKYNQPDAKGESLKGEMALGMDGISYTATIPEEAFSSLNTTKGYNPYPIITLRAVDTSTEEVLVESALTLGVSPAFACGHCHADPKNDVLKIHDERMGTELIKKSIGGETVFCKDCHTGLVEKDGKYSAGKGLSLSAAIHSWHTPYLKDIKDASCLSCHIGMGRSADAGDDAVKPMFMRDIHLQRGLNCTDCHGTMAEHSTALMMGEKEAGNPKADILMERLHSTIASDEIKGRIPWVQEPDCTSCHDYIEKPILGQVSSFNKWTDLSYGVDGLYSRRSDSTGVVRCISCHGASHALYPGKNPVGSDRDNLAAIQYQQDARTLGSAGNCALCHTQPMDMSMHHYLVERARTPITVPEGTGLTMPQVEFAHTAHVSIDCMVCHHTGHEDGKPIACTNSGCHDAVRTDPAIGPNDYRYFRNAFHGYGFSCFACHEERQSKNEASGPIACKGCHSAPSKIWEDESK